MSFIYQKLPSNPNSVWVYLLAFSVVFHIAFGAAFTNLNLYKNTKLEPVRVRISNPPVPEKEIPKPEKQPKKPEKKQPTPNQTVTKPQPEAPPIQGLTKDSVSDKGTMAAPVGNTLMIEDTGKRMNPNDVKPLSSDLSAPAKLINESVTIPSYTDSALDAGVEGVWIVDVLVDISGNVTEVELRKKIGYGMDERVLATVRSAKFTPRKNKFGAAEAGWTEIKMRLDRP